MRSTSTRRRLIAGGGIALALFGSLIIAERGSSAAPAAVSTKSIALTRPNIALPKFNIPALPERSSLLPNSTASASGPSAQQFGFNLPVEVTCEALLAAREAILETPPSLARDAALALNSLQLAVLHCEQISGD